MVNILKIFLAANVNESCFFHEQCEVRVSQTECRDGRCICLFEKIPMTQPDGGIICVGKEWYSQGTEYDNFNENPVMSKHILQHGSARTKSAGLIKLPLVRFRYLSKIPRISFLYKSTKR